MVDERSEKYIRELKQVFRTFSLESYEALVSKGKIAHYEYVIVEPKEAEDLKRDMGVRGLNVDMIDVLNKVNDYKEEVEKIIGEHNIKADNLLKEKKQKKIRE